MNSTTAANNRLRGCALRRPDGRGAAALCLFLALGLFAAAAAPAAAGDDPGAAQGGKGRAVGVRIVFQGGEAMVSLFDNPMSREFASLLPLTLPLEDFAGKEKIAYLPRRLATEGGLTDREAQGDFAYYAPWGNVAMFYKGFGRGKGLYILGRFLSGKEGLAAAGGTAGARMEVAE